MMMKNLPEKRVAKLAKPRGKRTTLIRWAMTLPHRLVTPKSTSNVSKAVTPHPNLTLSQDHVDSPSPEPLIPKSVSESNNEQPREDENIPESGNSLLEYMLVENKDASGEASSSDLSDVPSDAFPSDEGEHVAGPSWQKRTQEDAELDQEQTHCFGARGHLRQGHYHFDVDATTEIVEYEGWFNVADVLSTGLILPSHEKR